MKLSGRQQRKGLLLQRGGSTSAENEHLDSRQWAGHKFDSTTGQVFTERTASVTSSNDQYWTRRTRLVYGRNEADEFKQMEAARAWETKRLARNGGLQNSVLKPRGGTRSLQSIALESVVQNISDVTADSFVYLPVMLVKRIWDVVRKRCYVSFDTWALFSGLLHNEDDISEDLLRYAESFSTPKLQFKLYINPIISNSFDFITALCITTPIPMPDLIKISTIQNLGTLEIINRDSSSAGYAQMGVTDRLIRGWYTAATEDGAFSVLRVLRLWNHEDLTTKSLVFLNGFPSLAVYDVRGCRFNPKERDQARSLGWKLNIETDILKLLERTCIKRYEALQKYATPGYGGESNSRRADIKRIPRNELATFLANSHPPSALKEVADVPKKSQRIMERVTNLDIYGLSKHQSLDDWETSAYKTYARIGELRNDSDLQRAGIPIQDAITKGHELLNAKPMVLLRLGISPESMIPTTKTSINSVSFIRIKIPVVEEVQKDDVEKYSSSQRKVEQREVEERLPHRSQSSLRALSVASTQASVKRKKKRNLDDMLGSFM